MKRFPFIFPCLVLSFFVVAPAARHPVEPAKDDPILIGAGDIGDCRTDGDEATAALIEKVLKGRPAERTVVFTMGDNAYGKGAEEEFQQCYEPSWGRFKARTRPSPGNHDYFSKGAAPYYRYFGDLAGPAGRGYYGYDLGAWHVVSLNSNVDARKGSPQETWLRDDLKRAKTNNIVAYWHHPLFTSGEHGDDPRMRDVWETLQEFGCDIVVTGHDHHYERFAPQNSVGNADPSGIREFVVGTGGTHLRTIASIRPNSEIRDASTWGVLKLTLRANGYEWEFLPVAGRKFRDSGRAKCAAPKR